MNRNDEVLSNASSIEKPLGPNPSAPSEPLRKPLKPYFISTALRGLAILAFMLIAMRPAHTIERSLLTILTIAPPSPVTAGTQVTLTAAVTLNGSPVTTGTVVFCNNVAPCSGVNVLGVAQITGAGSASVKLVPGVGSYSVLARFNGLQFIRANNSSAQVLTVTGTSSYRSSTTLVSRGNVGDYTLIGTVTGFGRLLPSGTVSFLDSSNGNGVIGSAGLDATTLSSSLVQATGSPLTVGRGAYFAAVGDFNRDGIPDLVITNSDDNNVSVLLGIGDGSFQTPRTFPTGSAPMAVAVGDFNADGAQDLVVANGTSGTVSILLGNGDGTFQPAVSYAVGSSPFSVAVTDLDLNGAQDLVIASHSMSGAISVLLGNGDGTFQPQASYPAGSMPRKVTTADFNGDGIADVATANENDNDVTVLLGNGDGSFSLPVSYATGSNPSSMEVGDFNGDGIADLVVGDYTGNTISVLLGNGDGTFQPQALYATGASPLQMAVADFNGDNILDVAVANSNDNTVGILLGTGDGTFQPQVAYPVGKFPLAATAADFNGDGLLDLATVNFSGAGNGTVSILLSQQSETATAYNVNPIGQGIHNVLASYPGDDSRAASQSSTVAMTGTLLATTTTLTPSANPVVSGQPVTFTAAVTATTGTPTGAVSFYNGSVLLATSALNISSQAAFSTSSLPPGTDAITALYGGDKRDASSASAVLSEIVTGSRLTSTLTTLRTSNANVPLGTNVSFTATIAPSPTGAALGTVSFLNGTSLLGTAPVSSAGSAVFATTSLPRGADTITAIYSGNPSFGMSTSAPLIEAVGTSFTVSTTSSTLIFTSAKTVNATIAVTASGGPFNGVVTLSASGLPAGVTASFQPAGVTPGSSNAHSIMTVQAAQRAAKTPSRHNRQFPFIPLGFSAGICLVASRRKRQVKSLAGVLTLLLVMAGTMMLSACQGLAPSNPAPQGQSYVVTVAGTSGALEASTSVTVQVQ